jgi:hypothetical protein
MILYFKREIYHLKQIQDRAHDYKFQLEILGKELVLKNK